MATLKEPTLVDLALDAFSTGPAHLVKVIEGGGLDHDDQAGLVGFVQGFERVRNQRAMIDHRVVRDGGERSLPEALWQSSMIGGRAVGAATAGPGRSTTRRPSQP